MSCAVLLGKNVAATTGWGGSLPEDAFLSKKCCNFLAFLRSREGLFRLLLWGLPAATGIPAAVLDLFKLEPTAPEDVLVSFQLRMDLLWVLPDQLNQNFLCVLLDFPWEGSARFAGILESNSEYLRELIH